MANVTHITWPYTDPDEEVQTKLDPAVRHDGDHQETFRSWLRLLATYDEEEVGRIIVGTAILWDAKAGRLDECLHTAVIWERG